MLDLDHFKVINDRYGHAAGDVVLRRIGELMRRSFRGDDVVARWGGEEFLVAMFGMSRENGIIRISELLEVFRQQLFESPGSASFSATFSAGVAEFPSDGNDLAGLFTMADAALYQAKAHGRACVLGTNAAEGAGPNRTSGRRASSSAVQRRQHRSHRIREGASPDYSPGVDWCGCV